MTEKRQQVRRTLGQATISCLLHLKIRFNSVVRYVLVPAKTLILLPTIQFTRWAKSLPTARVRITVTNTHINNKPGKDKD
jgi:hypothetical protein